MRTLQETQDSSTKHAPPCNNHKILNYEQKQIKDLQETHEKAIKQINERYNRQISFIKKQNQLTLKFKEKEAQLQENIEKKKYSDLENSFEQKKKEIFESMNNEKNKIKEHHQKEIDLLKIQLNDIKLQEQNAAQKSVYQEQQIRNLQKKAYGSRGCNFTATFFAFLFTVSMMMLYTEVIDNMKNTMSCNESRRNDAVSYMAQAVNQKMQYLEDLSKKPQCLIM